jgi:hypothetical protein
MKAQRTLLSIAAAVVVATLGAEVLSAQESSAILAPHAMQEIKFGDDIRVLVPLLYLNSPTPRLCSGFIHSIGGSFRLEP